MVALFAFVAAIVGLAVGSFLNVVIYRLPRGESLLQPPSQCPRCGHRLSAFENVPIASWLVLGGRCRVCKAAISVRYPLIEAITAALFTLAVLELGVSVAALAICVLAAVLIAVAFVDLDHLLIPDSLAYSTIATGFAFAALSHHFVAALEGAAVFAGLLLVIYVVTRGAGLGLGDVKLGAGIGLFLGFPTAFAATLGSFVVGAVFAIPVLAAGRRGRREALPFGPFMVIASLIGAYAPVLLFGPGMAYERFLGTHLLR